MKMKTKTNAKIFTIFAMTMLMVSLMGTFILAEEDNAISTSDDFVLADDEPITSTNTFGDNMNLWFAKNPEKKAEIKMRIAQKRMLKAGEFEEKGQHEKAKEFIKKHEQDLDEAEKHFNDISTDGDAEEVRKAMKITFNQIYKLENMDEHQQEIKAKILEKKSGQMSEEQLAQLEETFSGIQEKREARISVLKERLENLKARYKILTGMSDEEINSLFSMYEKVLEQKRDERKDRIEILKERQKNLREKIKENPNPEIREKRLKEKPELNDDD